MNYEDAFAVNTDNNGNVVFSGCFSSLVDFDPGIGTFNLTPSGAQDIFISMLDNTCNFLWAKALQGNNNIGCGISILVDGGEYLYNRFFSSRQLTLIRMEHPSIFHLPAMKMFLFIK